MGGVGMVCGGQGYRKGGYPPLGGFFANDSQNQSQNGVDGDLAKMRFYGLRTRYNAQSA